MTVSLKKSYVFLMKTMHELSDSEREKKLKVQYITFFYGLQTIHFLLYLIANIIFCQKRKVHIWG